MPHGRPPSRPSKGRCRKDWMAGSSPGMRDRGDLLPQQRVVTLKCHGGAGIRLLALDAPIAQLVEPDGPAGHRAADELAGMKDLIVGIAVAQARFTAGRKSRFDVHDAYLVVSGEEGKCGDQNRLPCPSPPPGRRRSGRGLSPPIRAALRPSWNSRVTAAPGARAPADSTGVSALSRTSTKPRARTEG